MEIKNLLTFRENDFSKPLKVALVKTQVHAEVLSDTLDNSWQ